MSWYEQPALKTHDKFLGHVRDLIDKISFMNYRFTVRESHGGIFVQGFYEEPDSRTPLGPYQEQSTRKWLISPEATDSEIVLTIFKLCMTSMEHRTREWFKYKNQRICSPHYNVEDLVDLCAQGFSDSGGRNN